MGFNHMGLFNPRGGAKRKSLSGQYGGDDLSRRKMNQRRAARFRRGKKRLIKLIDTCGAETILQQGGQLNTTKKR